MEGYLLGIPSFAVSMSQHNATHFETAAKVIVEIIEHYKTQAFPPPVLMNINVPDVPYSELKGQVVTRLGKRHKAEPVIKSKSPRGEQLYWVGPAGAAADAGEGTDFYAVSNNQVSLTPLKADLTNHNQLDALKSWMK
jgi:5'-nucleotidase